MATRSTIALELADGTVKQVYCHWDGYLEHNGAILREHYSDPAKLERLLNLGDISSLHPEFEIPKGTTHSFNKPQEGITIFYGRDRGEATPCTVFDSFANYKKNHQYEEFEYIMRNGVWFVADHSDRFVPLDEAMASVEKE